MTAADRLRIRRLPRKRGSLRPATDLDGPAPIFLYGQAVNYANAWTAPEEKLAQFLDVVPV